MTSQPKKTKQIEGFTLIELLVVVAVLALLASIVFSNLGGAREGARISNALSFESQTHSLLGSDLVGWWNFNDPGSRYKDLSGGGNNGSCTSCPVAVDGVPGTGGTAMEFDGSDFVNIPNFSRGDSSITFSAWINKNNTQCTSLGGIYYCWIANQRDNDSDKQWQVILQDQRIRASLWDGVNSIGSLGGSEISLNTWIHITFTTSGKSSGSAYLYENGELTDEVILSADARVGYRDLIIGRAAWTNALYFSGLIDDVRIYSRALTASEIQGLYAQTKGNYVVK